MSFFPSLTDVFIYISIHIFPSESKETRNRGHLTAAFLIDGEANWSSSPSKHAEMISQSKKIVTSGYNYLRSFLIRSSSSSTKGYSLLRNSKISSQRKKEERTQREKKEVRSTELGQTKTEKSNKSLIFLQ